MAKMKTLKKWQITFMNRLPAQTHSRNALKNGVPAILTEAWNSRRMQNSWMVFSLFYSHEVRNMKNQTRFTILKRECFKCL